jgi:hypothetical protein
MFQHIPVVWLQAGLHVGVRFTRSTNVVFLLVYGTGLVLLVS